MNKDLILQHFFELMQVGDKVKVILDDERTPDTEAYHGRKAEIIDINFDDAGSITGNPEDNYMISLRFENGEEPDIHFRKADIVEDNET